MSNKVSGVGIKALWSAETSALERAMSQDSNGKKFFSGASLASLILKDDSKGDETPPAKPIPNVHQGTWTIEESDPSQDSYRNQLTGQIYRFGIKTMGELTFNFTIGQYNYALKEYFLGGTAADDGTSWSRARGVVDIKKCLIALTEDDQYCVLPCAHIKAREANTDSAVGIAITGTALEPENEALSSEYWFDASVVKLQKA